MDHAGGGAEWGRVFSSGRDRSIGDQVLVELLANPAGTTSTNQLRQQGLDDDAELERSIDDKLLGADRAFTASRGQQRSTARRAC